MEKNYYDEILDEITALIEKHEPEKALRLVLNELDMPYVPRELEQRLNALKEELLRQKRDRPAGRLSEEEILDGLLGDPMKQLQAVAALHHCRCEEYVDEIQAYFDRRPHPNLQALLIDTLIDQRIMDEFTVEQDGQRIAFIPRYVEKPEDTDGYRRAGALLSDWFESEDPSFLQLCRQMLDQEAFLMLPLAYEEDEGELLALTIAFEVSRGLDGGNTFEQLKKRLNLGDCVMLALKRNNN